MAPSGDGNQGEAAAPGTSGRDAVPFILALGSNLGDRRGHLDRALAFLGGHFSIEAVSRTIESEPWGPIPRQPRFLNLVLRGRGPLDPFELLDLAQRAEARAGRVRGLRYGPRSLDVDLIFFGDRRMDTPTLTLPHPRWEERPFVRDLLPEVAGDLVDPLSGRPLAALAAVGREGP